MFQEMVHRIQEDSISMLFKVRLVGAEKAHSKDRLADAQTSQGEQVERQPRRVGGKKVGRNDPSPCGGAGRNTRSVVGGQPMHELLASLGKRIEEMRGYL